MVMKNVFKNRNIFVFSLTLILYRYLVTLLIYPIIGLLVYLDRGRGIFLNVFWISTFLIVPLIFVCCVTILVILNSYAKIKYDGNQFFIKTFFGNEKYIDKNSINLLIVSPSAIGSLYFRENISIITLRIKREHSELMNIYSFGFRKAIDAEKLFLEVGSEIRVSIEKTPFLLRVFK